MTNTPDDPTMGEIMKGISDGEIKNCLDEIERSAYMIRKIILIDGIDTADEEVLSRYVRSFSDNAHDLPRRIEPGLKHAGIRKQSRNSGVS